MSSQCHDCCMAQALIDQKDERIAELEARELGWLTTLSTMELEKRELEAENQRAYDEVARLEGIIARWGEHTQMYEARIAELERIGETRQDIIEILESRIHEAIEVYAGMEGFIPETAPEAYCLRIIDQMNKALVGGGE